MNNSSITIPARSRLADRAAARIARIARWQRRLSSHLQTGDTFARHAGWTITRTRFGGRIYRDPRFGQPAAAPAPGPPLDLTLSLVDPPRPPPAPGALPAPGISPPPLDPARQMATERKSR